MAQITISVVVLLLLLPLSAASIGMPGCSTSCGGVEVPYPFGIGRRECYWRPGFKLRCDQSRLLLGDLPVQSIQTYTQTMDVIHTSEINLSWSSDSGLDGNGTFLAGLGTDGPYGLSGVWTEDNFYFDSGNKMILIGCNVRATLKRGDITVASCSALCPSGFDLSRGKEFGECGGMGCCSSDVMENSDKLNGAACELQVKWIGWNKTADEQWPPRVFIASHSWSSDISDLTQVLQDPEQVPVRLDWEFLPDDGSANCSGVCKSDHSIPERLPTGGCMCTCEYAYGGPDDGNAYVPGGCADVDECQQQPGYNGCYGKCTNKPGSFDCTCPEGTHGDPWLRGGCVNSTVADKLTYVGGCVRKCGGVEIPYPFGVRGFGGSDCYMPGFNLSCDTTHDPPLLLLGEEVALRVHSISLDDSTMRVFHTGAFIDYADKAAFSFAFSFDSVFPNRHNLPYSLSARNQLIVTGCDVQGMLSGTTAILSICSTSCNRMLIGTHDYGVCQAHINTSMAGMPKMINLNPRDGTGGNSGDVKVFIAEDGWNFTRAEKHDVPLLLQWEVIDKQTQAELIKHAHCQKGERGYTCHCDKGARGNPYDIRSGGCKASATSFIKGLYIVAGVAIGVLLVLALLFVHKKVKHHKAQVLKRKFFQQNRGRLLQQLVSQRADIAERMIMPLEELQKATNNFDKARELGGGGHGVVYKGILSDLHVVAIKKPKKVIQKEIDEFINEVAILSQINHRNIVKLYGCCLETQVPMLVYEFISNGTLYDHLHVGGPTSLPWKDRLRIAAETAGCLSYLHSTASVPIIHRDIKSGNILLDDSLTSKVADFGASRYVPVDRSGVTTMVQGTRGYLDPMYFYTGRLTEKSDVYSFGVMLVELLTRKKPFSYLSLEGEGLVVDFATLFAQGNLSQILDSQVIQEGGENIEKVSALAEECIKLRGEDRPTMKQVEVTFGSLQPYNRRVLNNMVNDTKDNDVAINYPPTADGSDESARRYSMEEEFMLSSKYPR